MGETESFVEFCSLLTGCFFKKKKLLCMCCFYLYVKSGGSEDFEEENHWFVIRPLHLDEQESRVRISKPVGEKKE